MLPEIPMKPEEDARTERRLRVPAHSGGPEERKTCFNEVKSRYHTNMHK